MTYEAEISRANPACLLFLIDQSNSMADPVGGANESKKTKAVAVADATNRLLHEIVLRCSKEEGIRDFFHVGVLGYGAQVGSAFSGALAERELVPVSEIGNSAEITERTRVEEDDAGGIVRRKIRFPIWFKPVSNGGTPMCQALLRAQEIIERWLGQHPHCYPPIVVNITDGESTDGDASGPARDLRQLESTDGNVLLLNVHISSTRATPVEYPDSDAALPDQFARLLYEMSSTLTPKMKAAAQEEGISTSELTRGFVFNADMVSMIKFLDIGTRPTNLR